MQRMSTAEMPNAVRGLYIHIHVCLYVSMSTTDVVGYI